MHLFSAIPLLRFFVSCKMRNMYIIKIRSLKEHRDIDENLSWKDQCKTVKAKIKSGLSAIRKLKDILPQSKLAPVYRALIESHLRCGNIL